MVLYINSYKVKPNMMDKFIDELNASGVEQTFRSIPGNVLFNYSIAAKDKDTFYLTDLWQDESSFQAHLENDALRIWHGIKDKYILDKVVTRYDI